MVKFRLLCSLFYVSLPVNHSRGYAHYVKVISGTIEETTPHLIWSRRETLRASGTGDPEWIGLSSAQFNLHPGERTQTWSRMLPRRQNVAVIACALKVIFQ